MDGVIVPGWYYTRCNDDESGVKGPGVMIALSCMEDMILYLRDDLGDEKPFVHVNFGSFRFGRRGTLLNGMA